MLPQYTPHIIEPFNLFTNIHELASVGGGVYLYFLFMKFIIIAFFAGTVLASLPQIIYMTRVNTALKSFCDNISPIYWNDEVILYKNATFNCTLFNSSYDEFIVMTNTENYIKHNLLLLKQNKNNTLVVDVIESESDIIDFPLLNIICLTAIFIYSIIFTITMLNLTNECDIGNTTPEDFSLIISNIQTGFADTEHHRNVYLQVNGISPVEINMTYKLSKFFSLEKEKFKLKSEIKQKEELLEQNTKTCFNNPETTKIQIEKLRKKHKDITFQLSEIMKNINNSQEQFSGTIIAIFDTIADADDYLSHFPQNYWEKSKCLLFFFLNKVFCSCFANKKYSFENKNKLVVRRAPEPIDIIWENLEFTINQRLIREIIINLISIILVIISFLAILGLNYIQNTYITLDSKNLQYALSIIISGLIFLINFVFKKILYELTLAEKNVSMTNFYMDYSIKLTVIIFLNNAIIPLIANIVNGYWNNKIILVNNIFTIFLMNSFLSPILWFVNILKCYYDYLRNSIIKQLNSQNNKKKITQRQANKIFENPSIDLSTKMAYLGQTTLMSFFYLPIFPIGIVISMIGLILSYWVEKYNLVRVYKRPEMINFQIGKAYFSYFKIALLLYSLSNLIFYKDIVINDSKNVAFTLPLIIFIIISVFPYHNLLNINLIGLEEKEIIKGKYDDFYFKFNFHYDRLNPLTKQQGSINYLNKLYKTKKISETEYHEILEDLRNNENNVNLIECYYRNNKDINTKGRNLLSNMVSKKIETLKFSKTKELGNTNKFKFLLQNKYNTAFGSNYYMKDRDKKSVFLNNLVKPNKISKIQHMKSTPEIKQNELKLAENHEKVNNQLGIDKRVNVPCLITEEMISKIKHA